jgi:hypothetical protein
MPPRVIGRKACLWVRNPLGQSKGPGSKRCPNIWRKEKSKETREFMKVGKGNVQHNRYDGHYV